MRVTLENDVVARVSKHIEDEKTHAESPGLALVRGRRARTLFVDYLETLARDGEYLNRFWLEVFNLLYEKGIPVHWWRFDGTTKWQEVDYHRDVKMLREALRPKAHLLRSSFPSRTVEDRS